MQIVCIHIDFPFDMPIVSTGVLASGCVLLLFSVYAHICMHISMSFFVMFIFSVGLLARGCVLLLLRRRQYQDNNIYYFYIRIFIVFFK